MFNISEALLIVVAPLATLALLVASCQQCLHEIQSFQAALSHHGTHNRLHVLHLQLMPIRLTACNFVHIDHSLLGAVSSKSQF